MKYDPVFFQLKEFRCKCCGQVKVSAALVYWLDQLRRAWSDPIAVNSAFRCLKHNAEVGGAAGSRHLIGCAADIRVHDKALLGPFKNLVHHLTDGLTGKNGWEVIDYPTFIHVAVPRSEALHTWNGGSIDVIIH